MSDYKQVPVEAAKAIAEQFEKQQVIILTWAEEAQLVHVTTYGVTGADKVVAAKGGELISQFLGLDESKRRTYEDFRTDLDPALYKEALELLRTIRNRNGTTPPMVQQSERILKAAGWGVRQG
jgi:hypothetical protein